MNWEKIFAVVQQHCTNEVNNIIKSNMGSEALEPGFVYSSATC